MDGDHWTPMGKYRLACVGETVGMIRLGSCFVSMCGAQFVKLRIPFWLVMFFGTNLPMVA